METGWLLEHPDTSRTVMYLTRALEVKALGMTEEWARSERIRLQNDNL